MQGLSNSSCATAQIPTSMTGKRNLNYTSRWLGDAKLCLCFMAIISLSHSGNGQSSNDIWVSYLESQQFISGKSAVHFLSPLIVSNCETICLGSIWVHDEMYAKQMLCSKHKARHLAKLAILRRYPDCRLANGGGRRQ